MNLKNVPISMTGTFKIIAYNLELILKHCCKQDINYNYWKKMCFKGLMINKYTL